MRYVERFPTIIRSRKRVCRYRVAHNARSTAVSPSDYPICAPSTTGTERVSPGEIGPSGECWHTTAHYTAMTSRTRAHLFLFISSPLSGVVTGPKWLSAPSSEIGRLMTDRWPSHGRRTSIYITW